MHSQVRSSKEHKHWKSNGPYGKTKHCPSSSLCIQYSIQHRRNATRTMIEQIHPSIHPRDERTLKKMLYALRGRLGASLGLFLRPRLAPVALPLTTFGFLAPALLLLAGVSSLSLMVFALLRCNGCSGEERFKINCYGQHRRLTNRER